MNGTTKKEIGRAKEFIVKHLELEMGHSVEMGTIHAGDYMVCFCSSGDFLILQLSCTSLFLFCIFLVIHAQLYHFHNFHLQYAETLLFQSGND